MEPLAGRECGVQLQGPAPTNATSVALLWPIPSGRDVELDDFQSLAQRGG
jgi:hypothetical protein